MRDESQVSPAASPLDDHGTGTHDLAARLAPADDHGTGTKGLAANAVARGKSPADDHGTGPERVMMDDHMTEAPVFTMEDAEKPY
ncbi:hypothetical protein AB0A70_19600 [Streptomyces morookaense]|uniref:hypothetical protein n=1 Tax=Streptomyces morookaense TaxID=1970 RepID=UPI0033DE4077